MTTITLLNGEKKEVEIPSFYKVGNSFYYKIISEWHCVGVDDIERGSIGVLHASIMFDSHAGLAIPCTEAEFLTAYATVETRLREAIKPKQKDWYVETFHLVNETFEVAAFDKSDPTVTECENFEFPKQTVLDTIANNNLNSWPDNEGETITVDPQVWFEDIATDSDKLQLFKLLVK